jgi:hypothetical protein
MTRDELAALRDAIDTVLTWPDSVRAEMARWLAPPAARPGNGLDPHRPPGKAPSARTDREPLGPVQRGSTKPTPYAGKGRRAKPSLAKAAEQRLLTAMLANPGLSVNALANAANASRSATGERLRGPASRGLVEKDSGGHWRLKAEEAEARPTEAPPSI